MSKLFIELHWQRSEPNLQSAEYSKVHTVRYNDNFELQVDAAELGKLQQRAHRFCFVANSLADRVEVNNL